ncbi:hypothetical protein BW39_05005 [Delftia sp. RIT313]|nr:hypothetical protein BW39_05005 [Delftia sp. RIT313]
MLEPTAVGTAGRLKLVVPPAATAAVKFTEHVSTELPLPANGKVLGVQVALATFAPVGTPVMLMPAGTRSLIVTLVAGPKAPAALFTVKA